MLDAVHYVNYIYCFGSGLCSRVVIVLTDFCV
jgi:Pyruvate/2-oxoacid:ferredoxin oxidoreductase delta subunit